MTIWMNKMSLDKKGEPLTRESEYIGQLLNSPKALLYIDKYNPHYGPSSRVALDALNRLAPSYQNYFSIFYVED